MSTVCIVLPVYNGSKYIKTAIESVLNQSHSQFTLFVIDDGSSDDTVKIIEAIKDSRLQLIKNSENRRLIFTLNKGIDLAIVGQYKYIVRMDADDISMPTRIEKQLAFMEANPEVGLCGSWMEEFNDNGILKIASCSFKHEELESELFFQCLIWHPSVIIRTKVLKEHNLRYEYDFLHAEDYAMWCKMARKTRLANIQEVLLKYRVHTSNVSVLNAQKQRQSGVLVNVFNLEEDLLNHPKNLMSEIEKKSLQDRYHALLEKIAGNSTKVTGNEFRIFKEILDLNVITGKFDKYFFEKNAAAFVLQYWSLWCKQYSISMLKVLFINGWFLSNKWPLKRSIITAGKCIAGWKARVPKIA